MTTDLIAYAAKALYILAAAILAVLALVLIFGAAWAMLRTIGSSESALISEGLRGVGLIVIGVVVFDVAKYLIEEEVMRSRELRSSREVRQSLTKFMTIIVMATSLEGLVAVFRSAPTACNYCFIPCFCWERLFLRWSVLGCSSGLAGHPRRANKR